MTAMESALSAGDPRDAYMAPGARAFDSDRDVVDRMDEADRLHAEMSGALSGMGDEPFRDPVSTAFRKYMKGSVAVSVSSGGSRYDIDCLEALPCRHGVTLLYRQDRENRLPEDGGLCTLSVGGRDVECRYTGLSWKSPGLGICGAAFIYTGASV